MDNQLKVEFLLSFTITFVYSMSAINYYAAAIPFFCFSCGVFAIITCLYWMAKRISGCQVNPMITLTLAMSKYQSYKDCGFIIAAQFLGNISALAFVYSLSPFQILTEISNVSILGFTRNYDASYLNVTFNEMLGTFFITLAYFVLMVDKKADKHVYAPAYAGLYTGVSMSIFHQTGAILDPTKYISLALIYQDFYNFFAYIPGSILGGVAGGLIGSYLINRSA